MERENLGDFKELENDVIGMRALLWLALDGILRGAGVTQIGRISGHKFCTVIAWSANGTRDWIHLLGGVEKYAKAEGCKSIRIFGRRGWARVLPDYSVTHFILEKDLI